MTIRTTTPTRIESIAAGHRDLDRRLTEAEGREAWRSGPQRLAKAMQAKADELRASAEGRQHLVPPPASMTKGTGGGSRLVARCLELRKSMIAAAAPNHAAQVAPVAKAGLSPGSRLVEAARARAAIMKAQG